MSDSDRFSDVSPWVITVVVVALLVIIAAVAGVVAIDAPSVESIDNDWGTVTENRTEIESQIAIDNPLLLRLGESVLDLKYTVSLNDIWVAHSRKRDVNLSSGQNATVHVSTFANNDAFPEWGVSPVNRNETTTVRVQPDAIVSPIGYTLPMRERTRTRTFRTDLLEPLRTSETRRFRLFDRPLLIVNSTQAHWGTQPRSVPPWSPRRRSRTQRPFRSRSSTSATRSTWTTFRSVAARVTNGESSRRAVRGRSRREPRSTTANSISGG